MSNGFQGIIGGSFRAALMIGGLCAAVTAGHAQETNAFFLGIERSSDAGWPRLTSAGPSNAVHVLEASPDFSQWLEIGRTHDGFFEFPDTGADSFPARFYRGHARSRTDDDDWKNQVWFPTDPFRSPEFGFSLNEIRWVKFAIVLDSPERLYFQDSRRYTFHYDFATQRLEPFLGMSPAEFDQLSLHTNQQQVLLGTVLYPPAPNTAEFGIQFVGLDPFPPSMIHRYFDWVAAAVANPGRARAYYVPTFEQSAVALEHREYFEQNGVAISSTARWLSGNQCYAEGWAVGVLRFVAGEEIEDAYADGRLGPRDILLTDAVPAEIPFLAGVVSLTPSTPNSHVAILARSFGMPFVFWSGAEDSMRIQSLVGRKIGLTVEDLFEECRVKIIDLEDELTPELEAEILDLKTPPTLNIQRKEMFGALSSSVDGLTPADIRYFGGKAANFGFLRREVPGNSPPAIAFSFDLWEGFLDQPFPGAGTLRAAISNRLSGYVHPPDVAALRFDLDEIREWIEDGVFAPGQREAVTHALEVFDPARKIRFRSSTNFEDTEETVGAGLYDSYSGCLLDDLDGDDAGPSHCDPMEEDERGVFRAIGKVMASFYNDNAFMERLRLGVPETDVGMAILVHHSFPDEFELANGVATWDVTATSTPVRVNGNLVTQAGAVPVTNPEGGALPEIVLASRFSSTTYLTFRQRSSLVPLGGYVLDWEDEYQAFAQLFNTVAEGYRQHFPGKQRFVLDFEYKKMEPDWLVVKQVREIPSPATTNMLAPFLLNASNQFCVFQGEMADVFSNHRLKSLWRFTTRNIRLTEENLAETIYAEAGHDYVRDGAVVSMTGAPSEWPEAVNRLDETGTVDGWTEPVGGGREFELATPVPRSVREDEPPLFTLEDFTLLLRANYASPQPVMDYMGEYSTVTEDLVFLVPCPAASEAKLLQDRSITNGNVVVRTRFYWPEEPTGIVAGYTAPLVAWDETVITGLIEPPIVLRGYYSQTYRPGHHNFTEEFIFEPRLEPGIDPAILSALEAVDVQWLHVVGGQRDAVLTVLGLDGELRTWK